MKEPVAFKWVVVFFVIGAVLGLLVLQVMKGRSPVLTDPVVSWTLPPDEAPGRGVEKRRVTEPRAAERHSQQPQPADVAATKGEVKVEAPAEMEVITTTVEPVRCDREVAARVREKARESAEILNEGSLLKVRLRGEWDYYSDSVRRSFVFKFSDSDACLNGQSRVIDFYYQGKLYAHADPDKGIEFK